MAGPADPRGRLAQDGAVHPGVGGENQVAQRLDKRPLAVDPPVQQFRVQIAGPGHGLLPQRLQYVPGFAVSGGVGRAHLGPAGVAAVEFGLHQRRDVDAVDPEVLDLAADVDVHQVRPADRDSGQVDQAEACAGEVDVVEVGTGQVDVLEPGAGQVLVGEISHPRRVERVA